MEIRLDNLESPKVVSLIRDHLASMEPTAPPESRHALDIVGLRSADVTFWAMWDGENVAGVGALKRLSSDHAEIKSMKTASAYLRQGIAFTMLNHLVLEAKKRGFRRLSLETGSMEFFAPARKLYSSFGFKMCGPFGSYVEDPNSVFMTKCIVDDSA